MINSTTSSDRMPQLAALPPPAGTPRTSGPGTDQFNARQVAQLRAALERHPEIRPEVVARGRELAADQDYPPAAVLKDVAEVILRAPDLTEE